MFTLESDALALPPGAIARTERYYLRCEGKPVLGLTQGRMRPYVYPMFTPAGYLATSESPADHPHHNSIWIASDHVHALAPTAPGKHEEYTYNFYVDETFQGRAPGTLIAGAPKLVEADTTHCAIEIPVEWRGPVEWGAAQGRIIARETRRIAVSKAPDAWVLDVDSELAAANWDLALGPTRHAYFNARVADTMVVALGGKVRDDKGRVGGETIGVLGARWVAFEGPVGGGQQAGIVVIPNPADEADASWFVADWGAVSVGNFRQARHVVAKDKPLRTRYRAVVYDGAMTDAQIEAWVAGFAKS